MFEVSFPELVILAVVALLVLGPERLPRAARFAGLWVRKARAQWFAVKAELEREMAADEMRRSLQQARSAIEDAGQALGDAGREAEAALVPPPTPISDADPDPDASGPAAADTTAGIASEPPTTPAPPADANSASADSLAADKGTGDERSAG